MTVALRLVRGRVTRHVEIPAVDVSVVLPVYNERGHLRAEIDRIREALTASPYSFEIIVVDDGSDDGSETDLRGDRGHPPASATRRTAAPAPPGAPARRRPQGRVVVWTDVDMTYPNDEIPLLVKELDGGTTTSSAPAAPRRARTASSVSRPSGSSASSPATSPRPTSRTSTPGCGRSAATSAMQYVHHLPAGFSCVTTLTMSFLSNGYSVKYVPIDYFPRAGTSKFHWWRDTKRYLLQVVRMTLSYNPLKVFLPIGLTLLVVGLGKLVYDWIDKDFRLAANTLLILFAALQAITVGLLADLVVRATKPPSQVPPA